MKGIVPVILCGGSGTRFWPLSTDMMPKQFLKIWQDRSLFQITARRLAVPGAAAPLIVCNTVHEGVVREQLAEIGFDEATILLEPERRDSAAAIAAAVAWVARNHGANVPIGIFPSDQLIRDEEAFRAALAIAGSAAADGKLVTFGIAPDRPATEFGYVERGDVLEGHGGAFAVASFHEKPDITTAVTYLASGRFDWNSGMFVLTAKGFLAEAEVHMKAILDAATSAVIEARPGALPGTLLLDPEAFATAPKDSIDYALFEKAAGVVTVPLSCGWSDLGNWQAAYVELPKCEVGNVTIGDVRMRDAKNNIIITDGLPVRILGVEDLAVVVSASGVLVTRIDHAVRLKEVL
ncbi:MAG: sugar phosphate nucleotidyltransferase [Zavarzinia sp.]|nr:sugar phosphate nucleotidyltransferase [Zavarzinia sp.]